MGGLFHLLDYNHFRKSRKSMTRKRCNHGTEVPRNGMKFPSDTLLGHQQIYEAIQFSVQEKCPSKPNLSSSHSAPSVVARLMGMDALPSENASSTNTKGKKSDTLRNDILRRTHSKIYSGQYNSGCTLPTRLRRDEPSFDIKANSTAFNQESKSTRPKPREHPQEEILQKFKKEFEAWQADKMWEQTNAVGPNRSLKPTRGKQSSASKGTFNRAMMVKEGADANRKPTNYNSAAILSERNRVTGSRNEGLMCKPCQSNPMETMTLKSGTGPVKTEYFTKSDEENECSSSPARIVVLRPGDENIVDTDDICHISAANARQKELSMEDFLEEVKNRLKMEINGKSRSTMPREDATDFCSTERSTGLRKTNQNMSKKIRESFAKDVCVASNRLGAIGFHDSEIQRGELDSSDFARRDKRILLTERLNSRLGNEEVSAASHFSGTRSRTGLSTKVDSESRLFADAKMIEEKLAYWGDSLSSLADKARSFREGEESDRAISEEDSPGNLVRSLSAPLSGRAPGKPISETKHVLLGSHVQREHKVTEQSLISSKKNRKYHLDFKNRVSSLRHNLIFKGKLFGKKVHIVKKADANETEWCTKDIETVSSNVMNMGKQTRLENLTEVPPSPAWSSSSTIDFCKPGHPSPVSPLDMPFIEVSHSPQIYKDFCFYFAQTSESDESRYGIPQPSMEISCEIPPTSEKICSDKISCVAAPVAKEKTCRSDELSPPEVELSEEVKADAKIYKDEIVDIYSNEEACERDTLTTAGLYETQAAQDVILRWVELPQIYPKWIFEDVVQAFSGKHEKKDNDAHIMTYEVPMVDRKLLFDLVSEALHLIVQPFTNSLVTKGCPRMTAMPGDQTLFMDVLSQIQKLTRLPGEEEDCSLESMVANDVKKAPWMPTMHEGTGGVGNELELLILRDLVGEFVLDIYCD